ncbi:hypothetical protein MNBD_GAMMA14-2225 [hydrothermal vent metagenome]|uniref:Uncharacterized protein n=1 Tax=hydrothermal vent metagenome TaxID=652676 RepID=A0A3B0Z6V6_9ZZZZ
MDVVTLSLLTMLELALVLGIAVFVLNRKRKQLQTQLQQLSTEPPAEPETFDSIASGYLPYLEKLILESRQQLESGESKEEPDSVLIAALNYRLSLLEAEMKVTERSNDYPENHWQHVVELFAPPEAHEPEPEPEPEDEPESEGDDPLIKAQARIKSLEKFRDHFFSMKKQLEALEASKQKLADQLETLLPEAERSEELQSLLDTMNTQRDRLQDELAQLESQSDELSRAASKNIPGEDELQRIEADSEEKASELTEQIDKQKKKIFELHHLVDDLHLESEKTEALQAKIDQFELANRDMNMCIQVLEEENQFLQGQIQSLLKLSEDQSVYDATGPQQLESLQAQLEEKDEQIKTLEEKYTAMEKEYLTLYEEANS